jgi:urate oxidase
MKLSHHRYGKANVRVLKKLETNGRHTIKELELRLSLTGEFETSYTIGENRLVVATDTIKNTINVLALDQLGEQTEMFVATLARHFLSKYSHIAEITIETTERVWRRLKENGAPSATNFLAPGKFAPICELLATREQTQISSGIRDLVILKSAGSEFTDFHRDEFTTLPETHDRLLATSLSSKWLFTKSPANYNDANVTILDAMLECFSSKPSPSAQKTMYDMGSAALKACPEIGRINIVMPNLHCLLIDMAPFGKKNPNTVFVPTDAPHGLIEATVERE